jgi:glutaredoxin 3
MSADVVMYVTGWCPYCRAAKKLLEGKGATWAEVDVDDRDELRTWLIKESGQRTVPQVFINGKPVGGFTDLSALDAAGKLEGLLKADPPAGMAALPR